MEKLSKRILIKLASTRPCRWIVGKIGMAMMRRAAKAPEVQERMKAFQAATPGGERFYAGLDALVAMGNEAAKSKWVQFKAPRPETMQWMRFEFLLLSKLENGTATASDIEEFRRMAEEVIQRPQCPPEYKQRIEAALASVSRSGGPL